jgi:hypothetical protein
MTDIHQKKDMKSDNSNTMNAIVAGIAGVVAGGVAVAAAVAMSNKDNQKKVAKVFDGAKKNVSDYVDSVKSQPVVVNGTRKVEQVMNDTKQAVEKKI